ncbi:F-BOX PROTEIN SKIP22 [Salix viminalis]|uniref:F-BOX PROTEIN SKIP22 n=1 Tax=Salix viminalis TaxID=40686 RepID=A0A9Q0SHJ6_SALVM|nr:F-BOX PROTEIN SKIP22 [Salix viminalis]
MLVQGHNGEHDIGESDMNDVDTERHGSLDPKAQSGETLETQELTSVEAMDIDTGSADVDGKRVSELYFMRKLLMKEMGDGGNSYKFLDIAVHAVFIESGFGGINFISGKVDGFHLTEEQASKNLAMSFATRSWNF